VGTILGDIEGEKEGNSVGVMVVDGEKVVGWKVGDTVGLSEGDREGNSVGEREEGRVVGVILGNKEGEMLGCTEGDKLVTLAVEDDGDNVALGR